MSKELDKANTHINFLSSLTNEKIKTFYSTGLSRPGTTEKRDLPKTAKNDDFNSTSLSRKSTGGRNGTAEGPRRIRHTRSIDENAAKVHRLLLCGVN